MNRYDILNRMLDRLPENYDKTEGSTIVDLLMPVAIELEEKYIDHEDILNKGFADTAYEEWLDKIVSEVGISRKKATYSTGIVKITGEIGSNIEVNTLVSSDIVSFKVTENKVIDNTGYALVNVECLSSGTVGNVPAGSIKNFSIPIAGLRTVVNEEDFSNGYNEETDEELKDRYYTKVQTPATSGNPYHYINWSKEVIGVGDAKVFPLFNGEGTVKVIIIDSNKRGASESLVQETYNYILSEKPVGAKLTLESATELDINIGATLIIDSQNYSLSEIESNFKEAINSHLSSIAFKSNYVSYAKIGSLLLSVPGVIDYTDLLVNGSSGNIVIAAEEVGVLGQVVVSE